MNVQKFIETFHPNYEEEKNAFVNRPNVSGDPPTKAQRKYRESIFDRSEEVFMKSLENFKKQLFKKIRATRIYIPEADKYGGVGVDCVLKEPNIEEILNN